MKTLALTLVLSVALAACGSKSKKTTLPEKSGPTTTEMKSDSSPTGGTTYGGGSATH